MIKLIDIGANLSNEQFHNDIDNVIGDSFASNIEKIITTTTSNMTFFTNLTICESYDNIFTTWGLHPHNANKLDSFLLATSNLSNHPKVKAIGEFGLDFFRMISDQKSQEKTMNYFLDYSKNTNLPLFLHERKAHTNFCSIYKNHNISNKSVVHCFTGNKDELKSYLDLNMHIGITGWICDERRNQDLIEAIKYIPNDYLMIETDSPYLKPRTLKSKNLRNEPKNLIYILEKISMIKNQKIEILAEIVYNNTINFFRI